MASKERKKFQKRKQREALNHQAVLKRREQIRVKAKEEREDVKRADRIRRLQRDLDRFDQFMEPELLAAVSDETLTQLEKNVKILKALETEHSHEVNQRAELNQKLEAKGLLTLQEKMDFAAQELMEAQKAAASAECKVSVRKPKREVAEVSVVKAPKGIFEETAAGFAPAPSDLTE
jgi:hypothetical protein